MDTNGKGCYRSCRGGGGWYDVVVVLTEVVTEDVMMEKIKQEIRLLVMGIKEERKSWYFLNKHGLSKNSTLFINYKICQKYNIF